MRQLIMFAGFVISSGLFAHDIHYTLKFIGLSLNSLLFLLALFWFHILVFIKESGAVTINSVKAKKAIAVLRFIIIVLSVLSCLKEQYANKSWQYAFSVENVLEGIISIILVIFPEIIFRLFFQVRKGNSAQKLKKKKPANGLPAKKTVGNKGTRSPKGNPVDRFRVDAASRVRHA